MGSKEIYFIYPRDETTTFLLEIPKNISKRMGKEFVKIISVDPNENSYLSCLEEISKIPNDSVVIFMGHGQGDKLWGAENADFLKRPLISKPQSKVFANKFLFCLSCNSNEYLKGTFSFSKIISSIGFGSLPTEMEEVENSKKLKELGVNDHVIKHYKEILIELVTNSFCTMIENGLSFSEVSNTLSLLLNKKITEVVLEDKKSTDRRILSDLLFQMKAEMVYI